MKKVYSQRRILALLWLIKDILIFLLGAGAAFLFEGKEAMLIIPLAAVMTALGWVWRGLVEGRRK